MCYPIEPQQSELTAQIYKLEQHPQFAIYIVRVRLLLIKMNIKKIKEVVNLDISDEQKERYILSIIADDKKAIPTILNILNNEREKREELILDSNAELSRALIVLKDDNLKYSKKIIADPKWVAGEIIKHYQKWKDYVKCNFKVDGLS